MFQPLRQTFCTQSGKQKCIFMLKLQNMKIVYEITDRHFFILLFYFCRFIIFSSILVIDINEAWKLLQCSENYENPLLYLKHMYVVFIYLRFHRHPMANGVSAARAGCKVTKPNAFACCAVTS